MNEARSARPALVRGGVLDIATHHLADAVLDPRAGRRLLPRGALSLTWLCRALLASFNIRAPGGAVTLAGSVSGAAAFLEPKELLPIGHNGPVVFAAIPWEDLRGKEGGRSVSTGLRMLCPNHIPLLLARVGRTLGRGEGRARDPGVEARGYPPYRFRLVLSRLTRQIRRRPSALRLL